MKVNGIDVSFVLPMTLKDLIERSGYIEDRVAAEVNSKIIPRSEYHEIDLKENDSIEIVGFVGGG